MISVTKRIHAWFKCFISYIQNSFDAEKCAKNPHNADESMRWCIKYKWLNDERDIHFYGIFKQITINFCKFWIGAISRHWNNWFNTKLFEIVLMFRTIMVFLKCVSIWMEPFLRQIQEEIKWSKTHHTHPALDLSLKGTKSYRCTSTIICLSNLV